ncbi:recombinase family protein [Sphingomonas sp. S1-29]|uniref:recombinase family protein n=1 Tax=Sphingomonas sp. S1-29 TaxID=2991074 RepID=UPI00223F32CB|nr:recombinase family protein [Sphingomonas sp. S1-29]UZK69780.1 recombinase family protein [Sphingomonas sp. S1-29]
MQTPTLVTGRRCAIYTRKSFDPPFGQEVTSLESQRAICFCYIASQQHKHWAELGKPYDDSGRSGANLVRPALQELLADIEQRLADIVVVYKLDRITRTLLDFVRLIDFFDRYGVAFVSITQTFDTSDSMGRLIRNILLTFAQFAREIASDRMRDKKMVMKQRGLWTGGDADRLPPQEGPAGGQQYGGLGSAMHLRDLCRNQARFRDVQTSHRRHPQAQSLAFKIGAKEG